MSVNPHGYGVASYISAKRPEEKKKEKLKPGAIVSWRARDGRYGVGLVVEDWGDYGIQVEIEGQDGRLTRQRLHREDAQHISLLDALARSAE